MIMVEKLRSRINEYFIGKEDVVEDVLTCLLAGGMYCLRMFPE